MIKLLSLDSKQGKAARAGRKPPPRKRGRPESDYSARDLILFGASVSIAKLGYQNTSVKDIISAANVARGTFYRLFQSKEEAFVALYERATLSLFTTVAKAVADASLPIEKLEAGINAYIQTHASFPGLVREFTIEAMRPNSILERLHQETISKYIQLFIEGYFQVRGKRIDPFVMEGLVAAINRVVSMHTTQAENGVIDFERCRRVVMRIVVATLAEGEEVPPLPVMP